NAVCMPPANAAPTCDKGVCGFTCQSGLTNCGGACVDTSGDPTHCGASCAACPTPSNGVATCTDGMCGRSCNSGFTSCSNGCFNLSSDKNNCGACGKKCSSGICLLSGCVL